MPELGHVAAAREALDPIPACWPLGQVRTRRRWSLVSLHDAAFYRQFLPLCRHNLRVWRGRANEQTTGDACD